MLGVIDSFDFVKGLNLANWKVVSSEKDLHLFKFPYYLKADVSGHKTELGAVLRCDDFAVARENLLSLHKKFPQSQIVVQESVKGIEMIVGLKSDVVFGKLIVVGFGGIFAEVKKDVSFRALPVSRREIVSMVKDLEGFDVFKARGKNYDLEKFYTLVEKVAFLGEKFGVKEMDLNPVFVGDDFCKVVDARIELN